MKTRTKYFEPGSSLTRGQMAKIMAETGKLSIKNKTYFTEVLPINGFHDCFSTLAEERGWVKFFWSRFTAKVNEAIPALNDVEFGIGHSICIHRRIIGHSAFLWKIK